MLTEDRNSHCEIVLWAAPVRRRWVSTLNEDRNMVGGMQLTMVFFQYGAYVFSEDCRSAMLGGREAQRKAALAPVLQ